MAEIARLGLAIDSSSAKTAKTDLENFGKAADSAACSTEKLMAATGRTESQVRYIQSVAQRNGVTFQEMAARIDNARKSQQSLAVAAAPAAKAISPTDTALRIETIPGVTRAPTSGNDLQRLKKQRCVRVLPDSHRPKIPETRVGKAQSSVREITPESGKPPVVNPPYMQYRGNPHYYRYLGEG